MLAWHATAPAFIQYIITLKHYYMRRIFLSAAFLLIQLLTKTSQQPADLLCNFGKLLYDIFNLHKIREYPVCNMINNIT